MVLGDSKSIKESCKSKSQVIIISFYFGLVTRDTTVTFSTTTLASESIL